MTATREGKPGEAEAPETIGTVCDADEYDECAEIEAWVDMRFDVRARRE